MSVHHISHRRLRAFTLIELALTVAFAAIILIIMVPNFLPSRGAKELTQTSDKIAGILFEARTNSVSGYGTSTAWGVRFVNATNTSPYFEIMNGVASRSRHVLPPSVAFNASSVPVGTTKYIPFTRNWGQTTPTSVIIYLVSDSRQSSTISVGAEGQIALGTPWASSSGPTYYCGDGICNNGETTSTCTQDCVIGGDIIAPTVSITAPTNGSTVSGTIAVTANASDNISVVGVQFRLDGADLQSEDVSAPYSISWDTSGSSNGSHSLTAVARDLAGNSTISANVSTTVSNSDTTPPIPNPMTFATGPYDLSSSSIAMIATTASDSSTVQYNFVFTACGANGGTGGTSSGWQLSTSYTDAGLQANKCYQYTVTARDATPNIGATSTATSTYTAADIPGAPVLSSPSTSTLTLTNTENGNPTAAPVTTFAVVVTSTSPSDATWQGRYVDASGNPSVTAVWLTDAQLTGLVVSGLETSTLYTFQAKARNQNNEETTLSPTGAGTTSAGGGGDVTAPTPNPMTFATGPYDTSPSSIAMVATTASDSSTVSYLFTFSACAADGGTGGTTSAWQTSTSYADAGLQANKCYQYTVTARDTVPNTGTASTATSTYTAANVPGAPTLGSPSTSTLAITAQAENGNPTSAPTTTFALMVTSTSPTHAAWLGRYIDSSGNPTTTAVWLSDSAWQAITLQGLQTSTTYGVQSKARNQNNDETAFGAMGTSTTSASGGDVTAPTPNPMTFATGPYDLSSSSIAMIATTASDSSTPVSYRFAFSACGANGGTGGTSSSWQTSTSYTDAGLQVNKCYQYTVTARDTVPNTGATSTATSTYTAANVPGAPTLGSPSTSTLAITVHAQNGNPTSSPATVFALMVTSTSPSDATWLGRYIDSSGNPTTTAVWLSDSAWEAITIRGMKTSTIYGVKSKARNQNNDQTAFGPAGTGTTSASGGGSVVRVGAAGFMTSTLQSYSMSVPVPATATIFLVAAAGWTTPTSPFSGGTVTLNGVAMTVVRADDTGTAQMGAMFCLANPATGTRTFAWNWAAPPEEGIIIHAGFYSGANVTTGCTSAIRSSNGFQGTDSNPTILGPLTAMTGDLAVAHVAPYCGPSCPVGTPSPVTWTNITQLTNAASFVDQWASWAEIAPTGNLTIQVDANGASMGLSAIILKP